MGFKLKDCTINEDKIKELLIQAMAKEKPIDDIIKKLAKEMFPHSNLENEAMERKLYREIDEFLDNDNIKFIHSTYVYSEDNWFTAYIEVEKPELFIEHYQALQDFSQYLSNQYQVNVQFRYTLCHYATPKQEDVAKPEPLSLFKKERC